MEDMSSSTGSGIEDSKTGIEIDPYVACSAIILARPNEPLLGMRDRLMELGKRYNFEDCTSRTERKAFYLEMINTFWGALDRERDRDRRKYSNSCVSHIHLNARGTKFLEKKVLRSFGGDSRASEEFLENVRVYAIGPF